MENKEKDFFTELTSRIISFLDPKKIAIILVFAVFAGLLGFCVGELFIKKEYRTYMTIGVVSRETEYKNNNLSKSHHIADIFEALYDNAQTVEKTLKEMNSNRTVKEFVRNTNVAREEKTVLVKINYTDFSPESALNGIDIYSKNLCASVSQSLGYDCFRVLSRSTQPQLISHTKNAMIIAVLIELLIAFAIIVIRVFPGVIIITGSDLQDFNQPILGEVFTVPDLNSETEDEE